MLSKLRTICALTIACLAGLNPSPGFGQEQAKHGSVEQMMAMLHAIDPYLPNEKLSSGKVEVFGSTSMDAMAHGWISGFKKFHPQTEVIVSAAGSEATFESLLKNPAGVGMLSRPVKDEELLELKKRGLKDPAAFVVAREALGVFVHSQNPVQTITGEQLRTIFTVGIHPGPLTWEIMGAKGEWAKKPLNIIARTQNSGTQKFLADFVFCFCSLREGVSNHVSNAEVLKAVSDDPLSMAICGLRSKGSNVRALQLTADNKIVPSDDQSILEGHYPLTRPLTLVIDRGHEGVNAQAAQEFVHYALCRTGQTQAVIDGFYPVDLPLLRAGLQKLGASQVR